MLPMTMTNWPPVFAWKAACDGSGSGMCVSVKHGLVFVAAFERLDVHLLVDGSFVRSIGPTIGCRWSGGLCVSPDEDSVLVAETSDNRVQEVSVRDGTWVRFIGLGVLEKPNGVDCRDDIIAVSSYGSGIGIFSWSSGNLLAQFFNRGHGPGQLDVLAGVRLLANGSGVVAVDSFLCRLSVFSLTGEFVRALGSKEQGLDRPCDVLECGAGGSFIIANRGGHNLIKISRDGELAEVYGGYRTHDDGFIQPGSLAALPHGGLVVGSMQFIHVFGATADASASLAASKVSCGFKFCFSCQRVENCEPSFTASSTGNLLVTF
jgi:hypothetical protein